jgi:hypothetical protein
MCGIVLALHRSPYLINTPESPPESETRYPAVQHHSFKHPLLRYNSSIYSALITSIVASSSGRPAARDIGMTAPPLTPGSPSSTRPLAPSTRASTDTRGRTSLDILPVSYDEAPLGESSRSGRPSAEVGVDTIRESPIPPDQVRSSHI